MGAATPTTAPDDDVVAAAEFRANALAGLPTCTTCDRHIGDPVLAHPTAWIYAWPCEFDGRHRACPRCRRTLANGEALISVGARTQCLDCYETREHWTRDELLELNSTEAAS